MQITDIKFRKLYTEGRMKAIISVTFDDCFVVHDIKIIEGQDKLFVAMPSRKTADGEFKDIAHPINEKMRDIVEGSILAEYTKLLATADVAAGDAEAEGETEA
jgi:stage V sporulation protein G